MMTCLVFVYFFFCKQKTAYEMRISDWSSDVCSSDLNDYVGLAGVSPPPLGVPQWRFNAEARYQIGRAKLGVTYSFIDGGKYDTCFTATTLDLANNNIPSRGYVNSTAYYKITDNFAIHRVTHTLINLRATNIHKHYAKHSNP